jgi:hypothetical protein
LNLPAALRTGAREDLRDNKASMFPSTGVAVGGRGRGDFRIGYLGRGGGFSMTEGLKEEGEVYKVVPGP